jgi:hypothetical protein
MSDVVEFKPQKRRGEDSSVPQRDRLVKLAACAGLWHTSGGDTFASVPVDDHFENWPLRSKGFKRWLVNQYRVECHSAPGSQALEEALRSLDAIAAIDGVEAEAHIRVAQHDEKIYLDLADGSWRAVEVSASGWQVIKRPPAKFQRPRGMLPLPEPETEGSLDELRNYLNMTDGDLCLACSWLVGSLQPRGPYPILLLSGEQGAAKSTAARVLRSLVDPNLAPIRTAPRDERDLLIAALNGWAICLDNLSGMPSWLSDGLCRLATGGGFGTRQLHTDTEEIIFEAQRPAILNGIADLASRPDLADRAMVLTLPSIQDKDRKREKVFWAEFEQSRPFILGALLTAVSASLRYQNKVEIDRIPRMADFAWRVVAAESEMPWDKETFLSIYGENRAGMLEAAADNDVVAQAIRKLANDVASEAYQMPPGGTAGIWEGTTTDLLAALRTRVDERVAGSKLFPQTPSSLGARVRRVAPALRAVGIDVATGRIGKKRHRLIRISLKAKQ